MCDMETLKRLDAGKQIANSYLFIVSLKRLYVTNYNRSIPAI